MSTFTVSRSNTLPDSSSKADFHDLVGTATVTVTNLPDSDLQTIATAGKVSGAALASLGSIPSGGGTIPVANLPVGTSADEIVQLDGSAKLPAVDGSALTGFTTAQLPAGSIVQVVNKTVGAYATGSTATPYDNTIPQNNEGDEYMTQAFTPTSATNKLKITVVFNGSTSTAAQMCVALFQDTTANALCCATQYTGGANNTFNVSFIHYMTSGTTSSTTFKVRAGSNAGNVYFNGQNGAGIYGTVCESSITIEEIQV